MAIIEAQNGKVCMDGIVQATLIRLVAAELDEIKKKPARTAFRECMSQKLRGPVGGRLQVRESFTRAAKECAGARGTVDEVQVQYYQSVLDSLNDIPYCK